MWGSDAGFYDLFLFDTEGNLVYTVEKEDDFATNFKSGGGTSRYGDSGLGKACTHAPTINGRTRASTDRRTDACAHVRRTDRRTDGRIC